MAPTRRGRATVLKKKQSDRYKFVDSDSDEVSPPSSADGEGKENRERRAPSFSHEQTPHAQAFARRTRSPSRSSEADRALVLGQDRHNREQRAAPRDTSAPRHLSQPTPSVHSNRPLPSPPETRPLDLAKPDRGTQQAARPKDGPRPLEGILKKASRAQQPSPSASNSTPEPLADPVDTHDMASNGNFIPTNQHRHMRACMVCSIVKTQQYFQQNGCPNCEKFLELAGNADAVQDCTSQVFEGLITVSDTSKSWVARWQRLEGYVPGVYAVQVEGVLPDEVITSAEDAGVHYIPRDGSVNEALPTDA